MGLLLKFAWLTLTLLLKGLQNENKVLAGEVLNQVKSKGNQQLPLFSQEGKRDLKEQELEHPDHSDFFKSSLVMGLWKLHLWTPCLTKIKPVLASPWTVLLINLFPPSPNIYNLTSYTLFFLPPSAFKEVSGFFFFPHHQTEEWKGW